MLGDVPARTAGQRPGPAPSDEEGTAALDRLPSLLLATARNAFACAAPGDPTGDVLGSRRLPDPGLPIADLRSARVWVSSAGQTVLTACARVAELGVAGLLGIAVDPLLAMGPFAAGPASALSAGPSSCTAPSPCTPASMPAWKYTRGAR
jgi:hypothetical protein